MIYHSQNKKGRAWGYQTFIILKKIKCFSVYILYSLYMPEVKLAPNVHLMKDFVLLKAIGIWFLLYFKP